MNPPFTLHLLHPSTTHPPSIPSIHHLLHTSSIYSIHPPSIFIHPHPLYPSSIILFILHPLHPRIVHSIHPNALFTHYSSTFHPLHHPPFTHHQSIIHFIHPLSALSNTEFIALHNIPYIFLFPDELLHICIKDFLNSFNCFCDLFP